LPDLAIPQPTIFNFSDLEVLASKRIQVTHCERNNTPVPLERLVPDVMLTDAKEILIDFKSNPKNQQKRKRFLILVDFFFFFLVQQISKFRDCLAKELLELLTLQL
jgi:hypothetical protein